MELIIKRPLQFDDRHPCGAPLLIERGASESIRHPTLSSTRRPHISLTVDDERPRAAPLLIENQAPRYGAPGLIIKLGFDDRHPCGVPLLSECGASESIRHPRRLVFDQKQAPASIWRRCASTIDDGRPAGRRC